MPDTSNTATLLAEARTAYHELMTGRSVRVLVDQNGERIEYGHANAAKLLSYIQTLEGILSGDVAGQKTKPIRFIF